MRFLLCINTFRGGSSEGNMIFPLAWKRFLDRRLSTLDDCSVLFVNNGFDKERFARAVAPYETMTIVDKCPEVTIPFDTHSTYWPLYLLGESFDYILRIDHDAFPSAECLRRILEFLRSNTEVDFLTSTHLPRTICHHHLDYEQFLDNRHVAREDKARWHWKPWGYPTQTGDLVAFNTSFFAQCLRRYREVMGFLGYPMNKTCPFASTYMKYGEICRVMGYHDSNLKGDRKLHRLKVYVDGSVTTDFWTVMCDQKMNMAGIVDEEGRSYILRNHLVSYGAAIQHPDWTSARDQYDMSFHLPLEVRAPFFHMGSGYVTERYFDAEDDQHMPFVRSFALAADDFYMAHVSIVRELTRAAGLGHLLGVLNQRLDALIPADKRSRYEELCARAWDFYKPCMEGYM